MVETSPSRRGSIRIETDGAVLLTRRRQPFGWPALFLSLGIHGAVFATVAWLSFGGQGHDGSEGMEESDAEAASVPVQILQTTARQEPRVQMRKVTTFAPANTPRLLSVSPTAGMMLPKWDMQPTKPLHAATPALAATSAAKPPPVKDEGRYGSASKTERKAAGKGAGSGTGSALVNARPPQLLSSYPPPYPAKARREHVEGTTVVRVTVSNLGRVLDCTVHRSAGDQGLDTAALRAVRGWRFTPAMTGSAEVLVRVTFRLS